MSSQRKTETLNAVLRQGWLPIFVHDEADSRTLVHAAVEAGCTCLEYTCRRRDAAEMIPWIKREYPHVRVFAATLVDGARAQRHLGGRVSHFLSAEQAVDLGVDGLISYLGFQPETYDRYGDDLVTMPAAATPQEALAQFELGATLIKIADPDKSPLKLRVLLQNTHRLFGVMITGGMTLERLPDYVAAGALICSGGFDLYWGELGVGASQAQITGKVKAHIEAVAAARRKHQPDLAAAVERGECDLAGMLPYGFNL